MSRVNKYSALFGGVAASLCSLMPAMDAGAQASPLQCEISASRVGGGVVLRGLARSGSGSSGSYTLDVSKVGSDGGADINQSGSFSVAAGGTSTLSEVSLSLEHGASYDAVLTVTWKGGSATCRKRLPATL